MLRCVSLTLLAMISFGALAGCSKATNPTAPVKTASGYGAVALRLTDSPAMFDQVNLDVSAVWVHRVNDGTPGDTLGDCDSAEHDTTDHELADHDTTGHDLAGMFYGRHEHDGEGMWIRLTGTPGIIDVLALQDGIFATLGTGAVPAGIYNQIRLVLGPNNTIVVDGVSHPLEVPSGEHSGFKLFGHFEVTVSGSSDVGIDFDAARSIHQELNGDWVLWPVVHIAPLGTTGRIAGQIRPSYSRVWVFAIQGADTLATTRTHEGRFTLSLLPPGSYSVNVAPAGAFRDTSLSSVSVTMNRTTDVGVIELTPTGLPVVIANAAQRAGAARR